MEFNSTFSQLRVLSVCNLHYWNNTFKGYKIKLQKVVFVT